MGSTTSAGIVARRLTQDEFARRAALAVKAVRLLERPRGTLASWDAAVSVLDLVVIGRNLPAAATLGQSIAALRRGRGFNQRELAELAGVTQPTVLAALCRVLRCDLDPCSPRKTRPSVRARMHFTAEDDGLSLPWHGLVFVNPPYGRGLASCIAKAEREVASGNGQTVVAPIPARTDAAYWHRHVAVRADVFFLKRRLRFGSNGQSARFPPRSQSGGAGEPTVAGLDPEFPDARRIPRRRAAD